jgi:Fic family protein
VAEWLLWFLQMLGEAVDLAHHALDAVLEKAHFWQRVSGVVLNERQVKIINRLLDGFEGKLTSSKWAAIAKSSTDTALRDINELVELGILQRSGAGGRSTSYDLVRRPASPSPLP